LAREHKFSDMFEVIEEQCHKKPAVQSSLLGKQVLCQPHLCFLIFTQRPIYWKMSCSIFSKIHFTNSSY